MTWGKVAKCGCSCLPLAGSEGLGWAQGWMAPGSSQGSLPLAAPGECSSSAVYWALPSPEDSVPGLRLPGLAAPTSGICECWECVCE